MQTALISLPVVSARAATTRQPRAACLRCALPVVRRQQRFAVQRHPRPPKATAGATAPAPASPAGSKKKQKEEEVDHVPLVKDDIANPKKVVIAQTAPAVRVSIGEEVGLPPGEISTGKMVAALKELGFDYVYDTLVTADLTIMEEGFELLERLKDKLAGKEDAAPLPMFTSCCPGWINYVEASFPEMIPYVSSCKSPHMMMGALLKAYFAKQLGKDPHDVVVTSVMPCVRKQGEADRIMYQTDEGARHVDHVLTTRDLGQLIRERGIDFPNLPDAPYDDLMNMGSGAAAIFGTTGGVMEAALRTVYEVTTGERLESLQLQEVRGLDGVKEATVTIKPNPEGPLHLDKPVDVHVAVANGLGNAKKILDEVKSGRKNYEFVEVMACPGGCIGGGGQPRSKDRDILKKRQAAVYNVDERATIRRSYENPVVQHLYEAFLGEPLSHEAHKLLHTFYVPKGPKKFDWKKALADEAKNRAQSAQQVTAEQGPEGVPELVEDEALAAHCAFHGNPATKP